MFRPENYTASTKQNDGAYRTNRGQAKEFRRERLEFPAIDREMLTSIVDNFEQVMAEGPTQKRSTFSTGW
jgi:hypothetical protein